MCVSPHVYFVQPACVSMPVYVCVPLGIFVAQYQKPPSSGKAKLCNTENNTCAHYAEPKIWFYQITATTEHVTKHLKEVSK